MTQGKAPQLTFRALGQHGNEGRSTVREVGLEGKLHLQESEWKWHENWDGGGENNKPETRPTVLTRQKVSSLL